VSALDGFMPRFDAREHHAIHGIRLTPAETLRRGLAIPIAPDLIVSTLFRLRGFAPRGTLEAFFAKGVVLERTPDTWVTGLLAGPGGFLPVAGAEAWRHATHALKIVFDLRAMPGPAGTLVTTETRVLACDATSRRAFLLYWRVVGPFSALIRRRWLRAIARACADA
jgi:hypothetical protein